MKKRLLSLLLLVAMLVTAVPLAALAVFAADPMPQAAPEFTEEDYNALYKQEGLIYAFDVMVTNAHWNGSYKGTFPTTIYEDPAYADLDLQGYNVKCVDTAGKATYPVASSSFATAELAAAKAKELAGGVEPVDGVYTAANGKKYTVIDDLSAAAKKLYTIIAGIPTK